MPLANSNIYNTRNHFKTLFFTMFLQCFPAKTVMYVFLAIESAQNTSFCSVFILWHPKAIQSLPIYIVFFTFRGNIVKHDVLERFYGGKFVNHSALKGTVAKTCKHSQKNTGFGRFWGKNADNGAKFCLYTFSARRLRGCLQFPSLGSPHGGKSGKSTHWKDPRGGNRGYTLKPLGLLPLFNSFALDAAEMST